MSHAVVPPFGSILTASITPFAGDGGVDYGTFWRLCRHLVDSGASGVVVAARAGEAPSLSIIEKAALFHAAVDAIGGRAQVIAAVSSPDTAESVRLAGHAAEAGCDAVLASAPPWVLPTQEGILRHLVEVGASVDLPMVVLNDPASTGRLIELETLHWLAETDTTVALVDAVDDLEWSSKVLDEVGSDLPVYCACDTGAVALLERGAAGIVSPAVHVVGPLIVDLVAAARYGDRTEADRLGGLLEPVFAALGLEPLPAALKGIVTDLWDDVGRPRLPLVPVTEETLAVLSSAIAGAQGL